MVSKLSNIFLLVSFYLPISFGFSVAPVAVAPPPPTRVKDTKVAVEGNATNPIIPPSHALSHNVTLTDYMRLPVEQYVLIPMPLGSSLTRISDNNDVDSIIPSTSLLDEGTEFELVVPIITFFKIQLQPVVYASVQPQKNRVVISSNQCILRGSPFIEKVQLNDRFDFCVNTTLTWEDVLSPENLAQTETCIKVDVDVPRPFSSIPRSIIERTGNAAMRLSLKYIQGNFVDNLAKDYEKWATDSEYRQFRASLSEEKVVVEKDGILVESGTI
ncbi:hypothetical protein ACHAXR_007860 [Thalassiosira sp. AJA248-18]